MAGRAGAMVGALKALRAERARYRRELDDYRREAAAALRSLPPSVPRVEVERPGPPEELQGILAEAVRNSQTRKGKGKRSGVPRSPDTAVWKDVSNVLESSERHLPVAEKYFKRVFGLIRDPDSLAEGESLWKEEDEVVARTPVEASQAGASDRTPVGEGAGAGAGEAEGSVEVAAEEDEAPAEAVAFTPVVIDHTKKRRDGGEGDGRTVRPLVQRATISSPAVPTLEVRSGAGAAAGEGTTTGFSAQSSARRASDSADSEVPSTAREIRRKAQEFLVELDLLQQLGTNPQATIQVPFKPRPAGDEPRPEGPAAEARGPPKVSVASSPIAPEASAGAGRPAEGEEDLSSEAQSSLEDWGDEGQRVGRQSRSRAAKGGQDGAQTRPNFLSDVLQSGSGEAGGKAAGDQGTEQRSSFSLQLERADEEMYGKLGIGTHDVASAADKIVEGSSLAPAATVVERLLGGAYDYQGMHLEVSSTSARLERIRARVSKPSGPLFDFDASFDEYFHGDGPQPASGDAEASRDFIANTIDDLFASEGPVLEVSKQEHGGMVLVSDFFDIPKGLQRLASRNFYGPAVPKGARVTRETRPDFAPPAAAAGAATSSQPQGMPAQPSVAEASEQDRAASARVRSLVEEGGKAKAAAAALLTQLRDDREEARAARERRRKEVAKPRPAEPRAGAPEREVPPSTEEVRALTPRKEEQVRDRTPAAEVPAAEAPRVEDKGASPSSEGSAQTSGSDGSYDKSKYQGKKGKRSQARDPIRALADFAAPSELAPAPRNVSEDVEVRLRRLEEKMKRTAMEAGGLAPEPPAAAIPRQEAAVDSQVQTETASVHWVEQSVQTDTPPRLVAAEAEEEEEEEEVSVVDEVDEEPHFDQVCDLGMTDIAPESGEAEGFEVVSLRFDGESEDPPPLETRIAMVREAQAQFKQEVTLDSVVEEILGRILSEELEKDLAKDGTVTSDDVDRVVHGEISRMWKSAQANPGRQVEYSDEFNETFLAHALLATLTGPQGAAFDFVDAPQDMEDLEYTEDGAGGAGRPERPPTPVRSAWGDDGASFSGQPAQGRSATSTATRRFDPESAPESAAETDDTTSETLESPPAYHDAGSTSSSGGGPRTPPTPATPRNFEEILSSVESKLKAFEPPSGASRDAASGVVRRLDLGGGAGSGGEG